MQALPSILGHVEEQPAPPCAPAGDLPTRKALPAANWLTSSGSRSVTQRRVGPSGRVVEDEGKGEALPGPDRGDAVPDGCG